MTPERFEYIRKQLGWSKRVLSQRLGMSEATIWNYVNGNTKIKKYIATIMEDYAKQHGVDDK